MTQKLKFLLPILVILGLLSFMPVLKAQTISDETTEALAESANLADEPEVLEGVEVEEPTGVPSGLGLWWRGWRERISIAFTFDPVKKAEKRLTFAEERTKLAEYIAQNSTDPKAQERAQKILEIANQYMERVEERRDDLVNNPNQRARVLLRNVARHYVNKERVFEKLEDKLPPEKLEEFQQFREQVEERHERFLENLENNPNVPQEVKDKVSEAAARVELMRENREEFRAEQKEILDRIKAGNQEARTELEQLREERREKVEEVRQEAKETREAVIDKVRAGDTQATQQLRQLNQERRVEIQNVRQETRVRTTEVKQERVETVNEAREELKQNTEERREQIRANNPVSASPAANQ